MTEKEALDELAATATNELGEATKAFESLRKNGSAEELVKAANTVTKATSAAKKAQHEAETFELVAVYTGIRAAVMPIATKSIDFGMLIKHEVKSVVITIPVMEDGSVDVEKVSVNTLGKRTVVKSSGNGGSRTRYVYGPEGLNSRQLVEQFGAVEVGSEKAEATLAEPSKYGLTHLADRIAKKLDFDKVPA